MIARQKSPVKYLFRQHFVVFAVALVFAVIASPSLAGKYNKPWRDKNVSIVLDAYAYSPIEWERLIKNRKLVGFINKASDGLSPPWRCNGNETKRKLCKIAWRQHKAEEELFLTRRLVAKMLGLKWGSYHLGRPGNPIQQALHYLQYAQPDEDDLIALDIEDVKPGKWMSLKDAEIFARFIKKKIGRYPLLYTNHNTSKHIALNAKKYPLLSRLNLWYARYRKKIPGVFPMGNWDSYTLWQFSSQHNCGRRRCPWRMHGTDNRIDVNVVAMSRDELRAAWPFNKLTARVPEPVEVAKAAEVEKPAEVPVSEAPVEVAAVSVKPKADQANDEQIAPEPQPALAKSADSKADDFTTRRIRFNGADKKAEPTRMLEKTVLEPQKVEKQAAGKPPVNTTEVAPVSAKTTPQIESVVAITASVSPDATNAPVSPADIAEFPKIVRIPVPVAAPVQMALKGDIPVPASRPYQRSDEPAYKSMDQALLEMQTQVRSF